MPKTLVFEVWGKYAHFKKIYATTTAVSYLIPPKTALYGMVAAIIGLDNTNNAYLQHFEPDACKMALQLLKPVVMQRVNTNLRPLLGRLKDSDNRKPTMIEYIYQPAYRIYFTHSQPTIYQSLQQHLAQHKAVYTPTFGLAGLLVNFKFLGEFTFETLQNPPETLIHSVIPMSRFVAFGNNFTLQSEIVEISQYAVEMDTNRIVTLREDVLIDRKAQPIPATVTHLEQVILPQQTVNVVMF